MAKVQIFRGEHLEQEVPLGTGTLVLGRSADSGIVLDHPSISRRHATVGLEGGHVVLRDAGSTNGVYVEKERVDAWEVVEGQAAELGVFTIRVVELAPAVTPPQETEQRTRILSRPAGQPVFAKPEETSPSAVLIAVGPDGSEKKYRLAGQALTVGRGKECDICFEDRMVSRLHARVYAEGGIWKISDMESVNGILVNGVRVKEAALTPGETVAVGSCSLALASDEPAGASLSGRLLGGASSWGFPSRRTAVIAGTILALAVIGIVAISLRGGKETPPAPGGASPPQSLGPRNTAPPTAPAVPAVPAAVPSAAVAPQPQEQTGSSPARQGTAPQTVFAPVVVPKIPQAHPVPVVPRVENQEPRLAAKPVPAEKPAGAERIKARQNILSSAELAAANGDCGTVRTSARAMEALDAGAATQEARAVRRLLDNCDAAEKARVLIAEAGAAENAGDWSKARAAYQKALAVEPGSVAAKRGLDAIATAEGGRKARIKDCFQKAEIFESIGELRDAIRLWQEILTLAPDQSDSDNRIAAAKIEKYRGLVR